MFQIYFPTRVLFGPGQLNRLHEFPMPGKKAMVVISSGRSVRDSGALARTLKELELGGARWVIFDRVDANPEKSVVEAGAAFARAENCDFVVALGGGSVLDAAKVMAMFAGQDSDDLWDFAPSDTGKGLLPQGPVLPVITITTTAGTGSEVDNWGVITNPENHAKVGVGRHDSMFPVLAVVDPELMVSVPPKFTAYQGFDALFHATEGYISAKANRMSEMVDLAAIEHVGKYLARAVRDGSDAEAREGMAFANTMAGYSMLLASNTSKHALEHAMSAYHPHLPHGAGLIMIARAYYTHLIRRSVCDQRFVRMAAALGVKDPQEPMDFIYALSRLMEYCGVADLKMSDYGITREELPVLARCARATVSGLFKGDRAVLSEADCTGIYEEAFR